MTPGRFVLCLDILGFKEMLRVQSAEAVCSVIEDVLDECDNWTQHDPNDFDTIHFSDTILLHARRKAPLGTGTRTWCSSGLASAIAFLLRESPCAVRWASAPS